VNDERLMREALRLAKESLVAGEQPIGAVVALDGEVIASARWRYQQGALLDHAEVVALRGAEGELAYAAAAARRRSTRRSSRV
jgi:tRNA(Arg) A34 adenosine deaminase TadA